MSIRNLNYLYSPRSVAFIGASSRPGSVGAVVTRNLFSGGFSGDIYLVNPNYATLESHPVYPDVAGLPQAPDLALIATPPDTVPGLIAELGKKGTRGAVVLTAGFGEGENETGYRRQQAMLDAAKPHVLRIVGPNCLGVLVPGIGLNASFTHIHPLKGHLAFAGQSGAMIGGVLDWATHRGIGFSHLVSMGDMADTDFGDMLDYFTHDPGTHAILLYIEAVTRARKFMSAARAAARVKPVVVVKAGRHAAGAQAASSHTGALAGNDRVYDAAFQRAGVLRVLDMQAIFDSVETLSIRPKVSGNRLAILTNGGGFGVLAVDALMDKQGRMAELSAESIARLNDVLPATWSRANPVDIIGDAPGSRYSAALEILLHDSQADGILVLNCPTAVASSTEAAQAVIDCVEQHKTKVSSRGVFTCWLGDGPEAQAARRMFKQHKIPTYHTPNDGVRAFMQTHRYRHSQELLMETPPDIPEDFTPDTAAVRRTIDTALAGGRGWLSEVEAKQVLAAYKIPVVLTKTAATLDEVRTLFAEMEGPVALKIVSPDITHKSDVGGVALDLATADEAVDAAAAMLDRIAQLQPGAEIVGVAVQPMIRRPQAHELIIGMTEDPQFGPVILFGQGGTAVELIRDQALALPPLNMLLARELIEGTRISRLLKGYRDRPAADLTALALTLVKVSQLACDFPEICELDINPLLADDQGVLGLDARIKVKKPERTGVARLAIRPYPKELEEEILLPGKQTLKLRPIRPEDEPALQAIFQRLSPEEIRLRFLHPMKTLTHEFAARLTQINYDREMALVLMDENHQPEPILCGVVRLAADPGGERAEFAILLTSGMTGMGLGPMLMRRLMDYAKKQRIGEIYGEVLMDNRNMLKLCRNLGFTVRSQPDEPGVMHVTLRL